MKRFFKVLRTVLLWLWFLIFAFLLILIFILERMGEKVGFFVILELSWVALVIVVGVVCETVAEKVRKILVTGKTLGFRKTKLTLENGTFGKMTFYHYEKSGSLRLARPGLPAFGEKGVELTICHYSREREEEIFRMLELLCSRQDEVKKGLCERVLKLCAEQDVTDDDGVPVDEAYVDEMLCIERIVVMPGVGTDDGSRRQGFVTVSADRDSYIFHLVCIERLNVAAWMNGDTGEIRYSL